MSEFLFYYYPVHPTTWVYLSSLLMIGLFFKFGRFWSMRNLDLVLLILLAPGLLMVRFGGDATEKEKQLARSLGERTGWEGTGGGAAAREVASPSAGAEGSGLQEGEKRGEPPAAGGEGQEAAVPGGERAAGADAAETGNAPGEGPTYIGQRVQFLGFLWLLAVSAFLLVRLLLDPTMVRRPLLEPNLLPGGLTFIGCSLFVFLMANVVSSPVTEEDLSGPRSAARLLAGVAEGNDTSAVRRHGPGNALLHSVPSLATLPLNWRDDESGGERRFVRTAKAMAIFSHLAIVLGIVGIGYRHFENIRMGIGAATLYLMLPYTAQMTGCVDHVLPAALLVWAVLCYRRPLTAGMFIGLAAGVIYYPLFLLPLWISFYWQRGLMRFVCGVLITLAISVFSLVFVSTDVADFLAKVQTMFGIWFPVREGLKGVWGLGWDPVFRYPILAAFVAISGGMAIWPAQKNLGTLISCSAAVMVATQFWHGYGGGLYMAWYLPLVLLTIFRPNLEDRVALSVLGEGWFQRRRRGEGHRVEKAA